MISLPHRELSHVVEPKNLSVYEVHFAPHALRHQEQVGSCERSHRYSQVPVVAPCLPILDDAQFLRVVPCALLRHYYPPALSLLISLHQPESTFTHGQAHCNPETGICALRFANSPHARAKRERRENIL